MNVFVVHGSRAYYNMFQNLGHKVVDQEGEADFLCFTGGADVTGSLYGDKSHPATYSDLHRDVVEGMIFKRAITNKKPMVGICRGAQFLNVMSGGRMYQHVQKHAVHPGHHITDLVTGEVVFVSSTHHQVVFVSSAHHQMIMPSEKGLLVASSTLGVGEKSDSAFIELQHTHNF